MLLNDLLRVSDVDREDRPRLVDAEKKISAATRKVNEFLRKFETDSEMLKLFERGTKFQVIWVFFFSEIFCLGTCFY